MFGIIQETVKSTVIAEYSENEIPNFDNCLEVVFFLIYTVVATSSYEYGIRTDILTIC
jgi:hypothetical protein